MREKHTRHSSGVGGVSRMLAGMFRGGDRMPSLATVLSGDTCYPISLENFEAYLTHEEYTLELLQFVVWFQDYRRRFLALPQYASSARIPFHFAVPSPARTAHRTHTTHSRPAPINTALAQLHFPSPSQYSPSSQALSTPNSPLLPHTESLGASARPCSQPFRDECSRVVATFLAPGAPKELSLEPPVRDAAIRSLTWDTHPDVFLPVYEELYFTLEHQSLPRFVAAASANINRPKRCFWYAVGAADTLLGVALAALLICLVHTPDPAHRAWRLFAVVPAGIGMMQVYSAYRGFCSQVWGRRSTQLHEWELEDVDGAAAYPDSLVVPSADFTTVESPQGNAPTSEKPRGVDDAAEHRVAGGAPPSTTVVIAPFTYAGPDEPDAKPDDDSASARLRTRKRGASVAVSTSTAASSTTTAPSASASSGIRARAGRGGRGGDVEGRAAAGMYGGRRPPVFGPERVVLDPRILEVHRAIMRDMLWFGFVATVAFTALVLAVPPLHR